MKQKTAVLLIGFGGPSSMAEVRPFLESVLEGVKIPQNRFDDVLHHYEIFNGVSPYNSVTQKQKESLEAWLLKKGETVPVYAGLRHSSPSFTEIFGQMKRNGIEKAIGFVLSPFRCFSSFEKYIKKLEEGRAAAGASSVEVEYTDNFFNHPLFLKAQSEKIKAVLDRIPAAERQGTFFIFSAHSIPVPMSDESGYADQFLEASKLIAETLKLPHWGCGYQSRSGNPRDPWLVPDIKEIIRGLDRTKFSQVTLIPVGFLCDNVEVLYDLDIEAKEAAEKAGLKYYRASTVTDHPDFIEMMGTQVLQTKNKALNR